ncbi:protein nrt1/ ptr family 5.7 [Phtheirospermum japonicum]|uniref:Protein nrt1/ ptr family 5.7 n=1 Tax=Phtheirospermum japonicum TaxID=374723 RepID=A0A830BVY1_9LAMI|nr:protein nrt1/ ptr family 5.7 [Phtheirospermum japonicum]
MERAADEFVGEKLVHDSSLDHKGRVPLRASTGTWKASIFIIGNEFSERLSYFAQAMTLMIYLTKVIHQDLKTAAKSVNYWMGVTTLMPLLGGFLADAYLGRFRTVLASATIYLLGLTLLAMSRVIPGLKPCATGTCLEPRKIHEILFFLAIYLVSIGTGGHKPSLESFGADQFDDDDSVERKMKMSFFNWWNSGLCAALLLSVTVIVYIQSHFSYAAADITLTAVMAFTVVIFWIGRPFYRFRKPMGSPLTPLVQVLVAAVAKRNLPYPSETDRLYEVSKSGKTQGRLLFHTDKFKFLDKAAIIEDGQNPTEKQNPWRLATVTKVEELKLIINIIPIWLTTIQFNICVAQSTTFFIKQSATLNRELTHDFTIPPASMNALIAVGMIITVVVYDKALEPMLRKITGKERGIKILQRIGIGMVFSMLTMMVAALVEKKRLGLVEKNTSNGRMSMSVFWLAPQFLIMGIADGFGLVGLQEYFYDQVPDSMRGIGIGLYLSVGGAANFLSSLMITLVDRVTEKGGKSWIGKDLNSSRIDYFYWLLAGITAVNLCIYAIVASRYSYKNVRRTTTAVADCYEGDGVETMA